MTQVQVGCGVHNSNW